MNFTGVMERGMGVAPMLLVWKTRVLAARRTLRQPGWNRTSLTRFAGGRITNLPPAEKLERPGGIGPPLSTWQADVLPLNYGRGGA